jgi:hypothetical protein
MRIPYFFISFLCSVAVAAAGGPVAANLAVPVAYELNRGQADSSAAFLVHAPQYQLAIHSDGSALYHFSKHGDFIGMELRSASPPVSTSGEEPLNIITNVYRGTDRSRWITGIPSFGRVRVGQIYRGVDLIWTSREGQVEYQFLIGPGADPSGIAWRIRGARSIWLDTSGDLIMNTRGDSLRCRRPFAFQEIGGRRRRVAARFELNQDTVRLRLGKYNHGLPLVVDPVISYSQILGGSGYDAGYAVAVDSSNNVYVTGITASNDFPDAPYGRQNQDVFVSKFSAKGALQFTTILASAGNDTGSAIAVDSSGNIYVGGSAGGTGFPATSGALKTSSNGLPDGFVAKLSNSGSLLYCTLLGGSGADAVTGIAVDGSGAAYVSGNTASSDFPVTAGSPQTVLRGGYDGFVSKLNATGSALVYSTLVGGTQQDLAQSIAVNSAGIACFAGSSNSLDLAAVNAIQSANNGTTSVMAGCLNASGTAWNFLTYLGGSGTDQAQGIALDAAGNIYMTGSTSSVDFPVTAGAYQTSQLGMYDAFVVKLNSSGRSIVYATYLGGSASETGNAIAVDRYGRAWVTGFTSSFNFPTANPTQSSNQGMFDAFVSGVSAAGNSLIFSTYLGGSSDDRGFGVALSRAPAHSVWIAGFTGSLNLPVTGGSQPPPYNAFLTQYSFPEQIGTYHPTTWSLDANGDGILDPGDFLYTLGVIGTATGARKSVTTIKVSGIWTPTATAFGMRATSPSPGERPTAPPLPAIGMAMDGQRSGSSITGRGISM